MNVETIKKWMYLFNGKVQENHVYLSDLDTPIGDGDHGANMARGMKAVIETLEANEYAQVADVFKAVSMQLLSKIGGASGPLYGSAFMGLTKAYSDEITTADLLKAGLEMIQKRGKAEVGEKTMVDVWAKVIADIEANELSIESIRAAVEATREMRATKGRASYVGERSVGHIDPGSQSSGYLFEAMIEAGVF